MLCRVLHELAPAQACALPPEVRARHRQPLLRRTPRLRGRRLVVHRVQLACRTGGKWVVPGFAANTAPAATPNAAAVMAADIPHRVCPRGAQPVIQTSRNISGYFDVIYRQVTFTPTAVLFKEQVLLNFVDVLSALKDEFASKCVCTFGCVSIRVPSWGSSTLRSYEEHMDKALLALALSLADHWYVVQEAFMAISHSRSRFYDSYIDLQRHQCRMVSQVSHLPNSIPHQP